MTTVADETVEWTEVRALIAGRVPQQVIERLAGMPASRLRHLRASLKSLRSELRREMSSRDAGRYAAAYDQLAATFVAGIMCSGTPKEAFGWLTDRRLLDTTWPLDGGGSTNADPHRILDLLLLDHRDREWQRELSVLLAEWLPVNSGLGAWLVAYGLAAWSETDLPASDGFISGWVSQGSLIRYQHQEIREWFAAQGRRDPVPHHATLLSWLRAEPRLAEYVSRLFEVDDIGAELADPRAARFGADNEWPRALVALADGGVLDRARLLDQCLAKLLRGDRPGNLRGFVALHEQLAVTREEIASRVGMYVRLAGDGAGTAAKIAQSLLKALDAEGLLEPDAFEELCAAVLTRPEKTLAKAQLVWIDKVLRRDPARARALTGTLALAFGHPAAVVQEQALGLASRSLTHLGPEGRAELREAAGALDAALQQEAARLFGTEPTPTERPLPQPPMPPVRTMPPAIASPAELAERVAALLVARRIEPMELERVLEGAVAQYRRDREAVISAFAPLAARRAPQDAADRWSATTLALALGCLMDVLAGRSSHVAEQARSVLLESASASLDRIPVRRILEVATRLPDDRLPQLLATPTRADGSIDPAVFTERLGRLRAESVTPWPDDLEQALLRLPAAASDHLAGQTGSPTAAASPVNTLPAFAGFHTQPLAVDEAPDAAGRRRISTPRVVPVMTAGAAPEQHSLCAALAATPDPLEPSAYFWPTWNGRSNELIGLWPSIAPHHPDLVAAHVLPTLLSEAGDATSRAGSLVFPLLAESGEATGPATHLALAHGLTAAHPENRTAAVDALLNLAARERLDAALLGTLLGALWREHIARPNRFLAALGDAARAGAIDDVWTVVRSLLPHVAAQPALRGLPDLLSLASECAATGNLRTDIPELADLSTHTKPARLAKEVKRLQEILRG